MLHVEFHGGAECSVRMYVEVFVYRRETQVVFNQDTAVRHTFDYLTYMILVSQRRGFCLTDVIALIIKSFNGDTCVIAFAVKKYNLITVRVYGPFVNIQEFITGAPHVAYVIEIVSCAVKHFYGIILEGLTVYEKEAVIIKDLVCTGQYPVKIVILKHDVVPTFQEVVIKRTFQIYYVGNLD